MSLNWKVNYMGLPLELSRLLALRTAGLETLALTLTFPLIGYWVSAGDPFYLHNRFPWLILAPLLISLRYGFLFGLGSTSLLITLFTLGWYLDWKVVPVFPVEMVVGMLLITLISAEFHGMSKQKIQSLQHKYHHLKLRMNEFSRSYHILKGSHTLLEQQTANYPKSMRTSLLDLAKQMLTFENHDGKPLSGIGDQILVLFSNYGSIQTASVYAVSEDQKLSLQPVACLGNPKPFWPTNPLVREAFKTGNVTSILILDEGLAQDILVVIPLVDVFQKIWGMVIVNEMPMFALQENTLDLLSLLGGRIGDLIQCRTEANLLGKDVWVEFEYGLWRVVEEAHRFKIDAAVVVSIFKSVEMFDFFMTRFLSESRALDKVFSFIDNSGRSIIINLFPLTDDNGLKDFLSRLELIDGKTLTAFEGGHAYRSLVDNVEIYSWILNDAHSTDKILSRITQLCHRNEPTDRNGDYSRAEIFS